MFILLNKCSLFIIFLLNFVLYYVSNYVFRNLNVLICSNNTANSIEQESEIYKTLEDSLLYPNEILRNKTIKLQ